MGGRTYTKTLRGVPFDVGGQWIKTRPSSYGPAQSEITLAQRLAGGAGHDEMIASMQSNLNRRAVAKKNKPNAR